MKRILAGWVCAVLCVGSMMAAINLENGVGAKEIVGNEPEEAHGGQTDPALGGAP